MSLETIRTVVVLGVDSNHDEVTEAAEQHRSRYVYPAFRDEGAELQRLVGVTATRSDFVREVMKAGVDFITGVGHGDYDKYTGHYGNRILQVGKYSPKEVRDKIIHLYRAERLTSSGGKFASG